MINDHPFRIYSIHKKSQSSVGSQSRFNVESVQLHFWLWTFKDAYCIHHSLNKMLWILPLIWSSLNLATIYMFTKETYALKVWTLLCGCFCLITGKRKLLFSFAFASREKPLFKFFSQPIGLCSALTRFNRR